ncbi:hypothetical protein C5C32_10150 [Rathayibacter sp. AY1G9]|uniref:DUF4113 domain-containing protein n=1 Tax=Rathayibacter sp. AY1G9 TaxID=2080565 RepID=UPI000CE71F91|nr:DUF4113 domain-containing protein [Rathayibacter sp. AY1G9]PPG99807.1 hypothetical protein C5C32_10150 [Rathayibacter sp. AY1G9]
MRSEQRIDLVDVNSFYVSCERLFDPKLHGRPGIRRPVWAMKRGARSPRFTTHWGELATAFAH